MSFLIIGHPEHRRVHFFQEALARHGAQPARVLSYEQLVSEQIDWADYLRPETILRIESPGENTTVMRALLRLGAARSPSTATCPQALEPDFEDPAQRERGRLIHPTQRFMGFRAILEQLQDALTQHPVRFMTNSPEAIMTMFDKAETYERFSAHEVPCPERLGHITSYEQLRSVMEEQDAPNVFIKLRYGSSASGVVAYMVRGSREIATTSARLVRRNQECVIFNSLQMQRYQRREDIEALINTLAAEGVVVERWMPKASREGKNFDLRVVVINGQAQHIVMRTSRSPMTNLHLGNARGDLDALIEDIGPERFALAQTCAELAHSPFSQQSLYAGADIMFSPSYEDAMAIEINAFGDLIPNIFIDGEDTYGAEVRAIRELTQAW